MRHLKMALGLAAAMCALAIVAVPATAHQFVSTKEGKSIGKGTEEMTQEEYNEEAEPPVSRTQEFKLGRFTILCLKAHSTGTVTSLASETFETTTKFGRCGWYPKPNETPFHGPASFNKEGLTFIFHANGFTETIGNPELEEVEFEKSNGEIEVLETAAEVKVSNKVCKMRIPAQTLPVKAVKQPNGEYTAVEYIPHEDNTTSKKFPSGKQKKLIFKSNLTGLKYEIVGGEGTQQCEQFLGEEKKGSGTYKGSVTEEVSQGDLTHE